MNPVAHPTCQNCGAELHGPICAQCGQPLAEPIRARRIVTQSLEQLSDLNFKFVHALRDLMLRPGRMINGYLEGRRLGYTNPFKLLFFTATFYFLVVTYFEVQISPSRSTADSNYGVLAVFNYLVFVVLALIAPCVRWLFPAPKRGWAENYVVLLYLWSGYIALSSALAMAMAWNDRYFLPGRSVLGLIYFTWAFKQIHELRWWNSLWRSLLFYLAYIVATAAIVGLMIFVSRWFDLDMAGMG